MKNDFKKPKFFPYKSLSMIQSFLKKTFMKMLTRNYV